MIGPGEAASKPETKAVEHAAITRGRPKGAVPHCRALARQVEGPSRPGREGGAGPRASSPILARLAQAARSVRNAGKILHDCFAQVTDLLAEAADLVGCDSAGP